MNSYSTYKIDCEISNFFPLKNLWELFFKSNSWHLNWSSILKHSCSWLNVCLFHLYGYLRCMLFKLVEIKIIYLKKTRNIFDVQIMTVIKIFIFNPINTVNTLYCGWVFDISITINIWFKCIRIYRNLWRNVFRVETINLCERLFMHSLCFQSWCKMIFFINIKKIVDELKKILLLSHASANNRSRDKHF